MTELQKDRDCRRVHFTYNSLLYKLDNIHLKQTYRGKPFRRALAIADDHTKSPRVCNEHSFLLDNSKSQHQCSDGLQNHKSNNELLNGFRTEKSPEDLSESDLDGDSDLSIDGANVDDLLEPGSWKTDSVTCRKDQNDTVCLNGTESRDIQHVQTYSKPADEKSDRHFISEITDTPIKSTDTYSHETLDEVRQEKNNSSLKSVSLGGSRPSDHLNGCMHDTVTVNESNNKHMQPKQCRGKAEETETLGEEPLSKPEAEFKNQKGHQLCKSKIKEGSRTEISNEWNKLETISDKVLNVKTEAITLDAEDREDKTKQIPWGKSTRDHINMKQNFSASFPRVQSHKHKNIRNATRSLKTQTFIKEYDNSLCLISDLLALGSSRRNSPNDYSAIEAKQGCCEIGIKSGKDEESSDSFSSADYLTVENSMTQACSFDNELTTSEPTNVNKINVDSKILSQQTGYTTRNQLDSTEESVLEHRVSDGRSSDNYTNVPRTSSGHEPRKIFWTSYPSMPYKTTQKNDGKFTKSLNEKYMSNFDNRSLVSDMSKLTSSKVFQNTESKSTFNNENRHTEKDQELPVRNTDDGRDKLQGTKSWDNVIEKPTESSGRNKVTKTVHESSRRDTNRETKIFYVSSRGESGKFVEKPQESIFNDELEHGKNIILKSTMKSKDTESDQCLPKTDKESLKDTSELHKSLLNDESKVALNSRDAKMCPKKPLRSTTVERFKDTNVSGELNTNIERFQNQEEVKKDKDFGRSITEESEKDAIKVKATGKCTENYQNQTTCKKDRNTDEWLGMTMGRNDKKGSTSEKSPIVKEAYKQIEIHGNETVNEKSKEQEKSVLLTSDENKSDTAHTKDLTQRKEVIEPEKYVGSTAEESKGDAPDSNDLTRNKEGKITENPRTLRKNDRDTDLLHQSTTAEDIHKENSGDRTKVNGLDQAENIPIIVKRLARSTKPKQTKVDSSYSNPYNSFPMIHSDFYSKNSKDSEYTRQKTFAETFANLPAMTGYDCDFPCPSCGEQVFNTGKTETTCVDVIHQMLLKIPSLQTMAAQNGLVVRNIAGDGNCMFSAIIDQLQIAGDFRFTKHSLRSTAVQYLRDHPLQEDGSHLESFLATESWEEYLNRMDREGEWGDHMILNCITEVIGCYVTVLSTSGSVTQLSPKHVSMTDDEVKESIYLGHVGGTHYVSLRPKDWEKMWAINAKLRRLRCFNGRQNKESNDDADTSSMNEDNDPGSTDDLFLEDIYKGKFTDRRLGILNPIATDILFIDPISRIPMIHLSFILRSLLRIQYFIMGSASHIYPPEGAELEIQPIGSSHEGMNVVLNDFNKSRFYQTKEYVYIKQIVFQKSSRYNVIMYNPSVQEVAHDHGVLTIVVDTAGIHSGYCRLRAMVCCTCQRLLVKSRYVNGIRYINDLQLSLTLRNDTGKLRYISGVRCSFWPDQAREWIFRERSTQWPKTEIIEKIQKKGCYIAHRSHPESYDGDVEFQFIFSEAECMLIKEALTEDMKYCFYVFKALIEFQTKDIECKLTTYFLKTALFYACEYVPTEAWRNSCGGCILFLVDLLLRWLRDHNLPNYFIRNNNMIDHWTKADVETLYERIETLRLFPCMVLHFISEKYGLTHCWLIDSVMASCKTYKRDRDLLSLIEDTFNPTTFYFAGYALSYHRDCEGALELLNEAFERYLVLSGDNIEFQELIDKFLITLHGKKTRKIFEDFLLEKLNLNKTDFKTGNGSTQVGTDFDPIEKFSRTTEEMDEKSNTYGEFLGPQYKGKYKTNTLRCVGCIWSEINAFLRSLLCYEEYEEIIDLARCLVNKCKDEIKCNERRNASSVVMKYRMKLRSYYNLLVICYTSIHQLQRMADLIDDYRETVDKIPSKDDLRNIASIWNALGDSEKAKEIENNMKDYLENDEEEGDKMGSLFTLFVM